MMLIGAARKPSLAVNIAGIFRGPKLEDLVSPSKP